MKGKIVEQFYKKVDGIDDKVKEASMPYMQWKVLFLVGENTSTEEISSLLKEDVSAVEEILASLESKSLIEKIDDEKADAEAEKLEQEEAVPSIGDELLMEEEQVISKVEEQLESPATKTEEEQVEMTPEPEVASEPEIAAEPEVSTEPETIIPDFGEEFVPTEEEASPEPESKPAEEMFSLDEESSPEVSSVPDLNLPDEGEVAEQPSQEESVTLQDDEFNLSLDEPEVSTVDQPQAEVAAEQSSEAESADEEIISDNTKKTIMVIDDSIVIRKMIEIALEEEDYNIITAISGKEGLETIEKESPNLVILDMMLPDMNGIEVLKTIKTEKKLPVIMLSGKDSPQLIETAKEVGVDDFLPKPFRDEELVEKVKTLIEV
jgi:CheY-like chemotaxis protein/DNA-binding MarR family transcriptional regulator